MTIHAEQVGRNLHLSVEGLDASPYVIKPLPGRAGLYATEIYLAGSTGNARAEEMAAVMIMCVDGAVHDPETDTWSPVPPEEQVNYTRIGLELSQSEAEDVLMPAFFWQTLLGIDGVKAYVSEGGGLAGAVKATGALARRLAIFDQRTSPLTASGAPTSAASSPSTSSRPSGEKPGKQPRDRQPKKSKPKRG